MHGFSAREQVRAAFGQFEFGEIEHLDIGEYEDPSQAFDQYYVFRVRRRQDVIRWQSRLDAGAVEGRMRPLLLRSPDGASYRVQAACVAKQRLDDGLIEYVFEAQLPPSIAQPARERHGVDGLAAALLLDAVNTTDDD